MADVLGLHKDPDALTEVITLQVKNTTLPEYLQQIMFYILGFFVDFLFIPIEQKEKIAGRIDVGL